MYQSNFLEIFLSGLGVHRKPLAGISPRPRRQGRDAKARQFQPHRSPYRDAEIGNLEKRQRARLLLRINHSQKTRDLAKRLLQGKQLTVFPRIAQPGIAIDIRRMQLQHPVNLWIRRSSPHRLDQPLLVTAREQIIPVKQIGVVEDVGINDGRPFSGIQPQLCHQIVFFTLLLVGRETLVLEPGPFLVTGLELGHDTTVIPVIPGKREDPLPTARRNREWMLPVVTPSVTLEHDRVGLMATGPLHVIDAVLQGRVKYFGGPDKPFLHPHHDRRFQLLDCRLGGVDQYHRMQHDFLQTSAHCPVELKPPVLGRSRQRRQRMQADIAAEIPEGLDLPKREVVVGK
ncbi:MAG: hypothetical protein HONDAALG_04452 [Gammaproteobacteria bacterium]|nr:hypothetical protein [Gammaproteobacteria bacterium]